MTRFAFWDRFAGRFDSSALFIVLIMVKYNCCVPNCSNSWRNSPGLKFHTISSNRAEKRLRMRAVDSFWRFFDRFTPLNNVVLAGDFLAITTFDNMHERMETWRGKANTTL